MNTLSSSCIIADPGGRAVEGVGLRLLSCWDFGFESLQGHGRLSFVVVVCCQVEVSASGRSLVQRSTTECDRVAVMGGHDREPCRSAKEKKYVCS
jgi:hypothetical protein